MYQMVNNKDKNINNSSNSLVFGRWPQTKIGHKKSVSGSILKVLGPSLWSCLIMPSYFIPRLDNFLQTDSLAGKLKQDEQDETGGGNSCHQHPS